MKKLFLLALLLAFTSIGLGQGSGPITVKEVDGSPVCNNCRTFVFPNGSLTVSGNKVTVASGGGSGSPGGSNTQLQYNNGGSFGGITGATTNGTVVTLTSPVFVTPALGTPASGVATNLTGTAAGLTAGAATVLATARNINGVAFDGSANITVTAAAGTLTGATLAAGVTASSLTSFGSTPTIITPSFTTGFTIGGVAATGTIPRGNGTNFVASAYTMAAPGTTGNVLTSDGTNWLSSPPSGGGGGITIGTTTITSGTTTRVLFNNAGVVGEYTVTGTGNAVLSASPTLTGTVGMAAQTNSGTITQTSASATAFESGPNGGTNPVFRIVNSTASAATGLSITGNAATGGVTLTVLSSGSNERLNLAAKGTSDVRIVGTGTSTTVALGVGSDQIGFWNNSDVQLGLITGSVTRAVVNSEGIRIGSALGFVWSNATVPSGGTVDLTLRRAAAANLAFGATDAAAPVAQTQSVQNVVAGTSNTAGVDWTKKASAGTGTGVGGAHVWQVAPAGSSGTSQNSFVEAMRITGAGVIQYPTTITAGGTTGNQTIDKVSGTVNIAAAGTTVTVTSNKVTANSICFAVLRTNDATAALKNVVPGAGSFTINLTAATTAETSIGFFCINP